MVIVLLIILDQAIKYFAYQSKPMEVLIPKWLEVRYMENTGTAFGFAEGQNTTLIVLSICILLLITIIFYLTTQRYDKIRFCWKAVLAGGISNVLDRIFRGFVVDYLFIQPFGVCNLADLMVVFGAIGLIFQTLMVIGTDSEV